jgi:hypothetical protein
MSPARTAQTDCAQGPFSNDVNYRVSSAVLSLTPKAELRLSTYSSHTDAAANVTEAGPKPPVRIKAGRLGNGTGLYRPHLAVTGNLSRSKKRALSGCAKKSDTDCI